MQKTFAILLSLMLLVSIVLFSCKKNNDNKSKKDYITASPWKFSQAGLDPNEDGTVDQVIPTILLQSCSTDNIYTFKSDLTGTADEGATKCLSSDPQTAPFSWSLNSNESELTVSTAIFAGVGGTAKILEASSSKLRLSTKVAIPGYPGQQTVIVDMVH